MRGRTRVLLTMSVAVFALAAAVVSADATTLTVFERDFRAVWRPLTFEASGLAVRCEVTLEGSFLETRITKTAAARIAAITAARVGTCTGGTVQALTERLPWNVRYRSFVGTLPDITSVAMDIVGASFRITPREASTCTATTTESHPAIAIAERARVGEITGLRMEESTTIPLSGELLCSLSSGRLAGTAAVVVREAAETAELMVTLGADGTVLIENGAREEAEPPIADHVIASNETQTSIGIENRSQTREAIIQTVAFIGGDSSFFRFGTAESSDCVREFTLRKRRANACNVRVFYTGESGQRPRRTTVKITYRMRGTNEEEVAQEFAITAER